MSSLDRSSETASTDSFVDRCKNGVCQHLINGSEDDFRASVVIENCAGNSIDGMEGGCGVRCLNDGDGRECVVVHENGIVVVPPSSETGCIRSIVSNGESVDGLTGNCDAELAVIGRNEMEERFVVSDCCSNRNVGENDELCCSIQLDGCENAACDDNDNRVVLEPLGQILVSRDCLESCSSPINTSGVAINGIHLGVTSENEDRCGVSECCSEEGKQEILLCSSPKLDECENILCHNEVVRGSEVKRPTSDPCSETDRLPSIDHDRDAFDTTDRTRFGFVSESDAELSIVVGNGPCCKESDKTNKLCSSPQLDGCDNVLGENEVVLGSKGHLTVSQSCLEMSYPSKSSSGVRDMGDMSRFQPGVGSENGMKLSTTSWSEKEEDCGARMFCSNVHNMEDQLCCSPQCDEFKNLVSKDNLQSQLHRSQSYSGADCSVINSNEGIGVHRDHFQVKVASMSGAQPSITGRNDVEDRCGVRWLCSAESNMEDQLCNLLKYSKSKNLVCENGAEPLIVGIGKSEVGDGCGVGGSCSNISNTENQFRSSLQCNGCENVACMNDVHRPDGPLPTSRVYSETDCTVINIDYDALDGPIRHCFNVNDAERRIGTKDGCDISGLCFNESNMENYVSTSGSRKELCFEAAGPRNGGRLGNPSYDEDTPLVSRSNWAEQNWHQEKPCVLGSSEETLTDLKRIEEERCLVFANNVSTSLPTQTSWIKESPCILAEGPPDAASYCAVEESASPQPSQLPDGLNLSSSKHVVPDTHERDGGCSVDSSKRAVNDRNVEVNLDCVVRNAYACKPNWLARTRKAARQCRQEVDTAGIFLSKARGKRSSCKQARSSIWGTLDNIIQAFQINHEILKFNYQPAQVPNQGSRKSRAGLGSRKRHKAQIKGLKAKQRATNHVRLKVKNKGKEGQRSLEAVLPDVVETPASVHTVVSDCLPPSDSRAGFEVFETAIEIKHKVGGDGCGVGLFPCLVQNFERLDMPQDVSVRDAHALIGDKDLESTVTQDTSIENTSGDCPGIYSLIGIDTSGEAVDNRHLDPGTSPDSDVLHVLPDVGIHATEGIISARQKAYTYVRRRVRNESFPDSTVTRSFDGTVSSPSQAVTASDVVPSNMKHTSTKRGKKTCKGGMHQTVEFLTVEDKLLGSAKKSATGRAARKVGNGLDPGNTSNLTTSGNASSKASSGEALTMNPSMSELEHYGEVLKVENGFETRSLSGQDVGTSQSESWMLEGLLPPGKMKGGKLRKRSKAGASKHRSQAPCSMGPRRGNDRGRKGASKNKVKGMDLSGEVTYKEESHTLAAVDESGGRTDTGNNVASKDMSSSIMLHMGNDQELNKLCHSSELQYLRPRLAWVRCDDCHKWRYIPTQLADEIEETDCRWTCKDNKDKAFADCLIPQEKSNAEINAELEISDASCEEDSCSARPSSKGLEPRQLTASQQASWMLIKSNLFLHRSCRTQTIDEVMVCHCKPPLDGSLGCGYECLNRILNIECVQGTCPCGDRCSNQQFQKRKYAKFKWFRCGKKGYGLQLQENVSQASFLIEYVGEVLDLHAYEARQREYASRGQKHFYFMTLNGSEVIDACAKGNLGRFINHSCDPNCRTEKWMVNGEVCIGLFAIRDIKKGEEVTFDYNYVRVFGAAAKKCVCGSSECRGYIGGDPSNTEAIVQGDSDEEYPEPVMVHEVYEVEHSMEDRIPSTCSLDAVSVQHVGVPLETTTIRNSVHSIKELESSSQMQQSITKSSHVLQQSEVSLQTEDGVCKSAPAESQLGISLQVEDNVRKSSPAIQQFEVPLQTEDTKRQSFSTIQPLDITSENASAVGKSASGFVEDNSKSVSDIVEDKSIVPKSRPLVKSSRSSGSIKKGKCSAFHGIANKPKRLIEGAGSGRFEGVEDKLNELLDADGGISKRKDATKGYLKLLLVTAASGDHVNGEAFQSTRDLSLVLDAILKTKSKMVLLDIINKNGLQMLHNIMKQNRKKFNKIPIIRKLLKVLEFLALKEILTVEHIHTGPPCAGMESFKDSIITLTRHNDTQVQQISRSFRDRWMPRTIRRINFTDRDDGKFEPQSGYCNRSSVSHRHWHDQSIRHTDAIDCVSEATPVPIPPDADRPDGTCLLPAQSGSVAVSANSIPIDGTKRTRKRKSRWDRPAEVNLDPQPLHLVEDQLSTLNSLHQPISEVLPNETTKIQRETNCRDDAEREHINDDAPPGFSSPHKNPLVATGATSSTAIRNCSPLVPNSSCACEVVAGHSQKRFLRHLPVSYGIPLAFVQQLGTPKEEAGDGWAIAPGLPFHPFPPLPKYKRGQTRPPAPPPASTHNRMTGGIGDEARHASIHDMDPNIPSAASVVRPQEAAATGASHPHASERARSSSSSDGLGRRYFRQQKWNGRGNCKGLPPPWLRPRNGRVFKGNINMRNVVTTMGNAGNETRESAAAGGLCYTESVNNCSNGIDKNSTFYQPHQQQYQN